MAAKPVDVHAAGAVVWRVERGKLQVLVVHRAKWNDWGLPKGKLEPGEGLAECAVREIAEETGVLVQLGQRLEPVRYQLDDGRWKQTTYWVAKEIGAGHPALQGRSLPLRAPKSEIDKVEWLTVKEARARLTYEHDRECVADVADLYADDRLDTWTLVIARHARAIKRHAFKPGTEHDRPLTKAGKVQAGALAGLFSAFGIRYLISSPWERCAATVRPYAKATCIEVDYRPELTEAAHKERPAPVARLVRSQILRRDEPFVLCTHRPVLPTVLDEVLEKAPGRVRKSLKLADPYLRPGECLVLHMARRRRGAVVVAAEYVRAGKKDR
ncbi:MAG: NUDIX hydrolase [Buchananella hordeovulneris]|nr:NUDIX hydrolase [Buchananella hordeovulneris]